MDFLQTLSLLTGIKPADLSEVPDPRGRVDFMASKILERAVAGVGIPDVAATYIAARPMIDGALVKFLGGFRIPEESLKATGSIVQSIQTARKSA